MKHFGDALINSVRQKGNPCVVGLDFHEKLLPRFVTRSFEQCQASEFREIVSGFFCNIVEAVARLVPAVKPQYSLLETYGSVGAQILDDVIRAAHNHGLIVIVDAKRGDIASSAKGYADAFLAPLNARPFPHGYDADALTVNAFLGRDTLDPYIEVSKSSGKGIFVLVKTSNPGSEETQDAVLASGKTISQVYGEIVNQLGVSLIGASGYSSVGAVVGATFPSQAKELRHIMPKSIILVPGYGTQGATAKDVIVNFNADGLGAIVNASRSVTYAYGSTDVSAKNYYLSVADNTSRMIEDITQALRETHPTPDNTE